MISAGTNCNRTVCRLQPRYLMRFKVIAALFAMAGCSGRPLPIPEGESVADMALPPDVVVARICALVVGCDLGFRASSVSYCVAEWDHLLDRPDRQLAAKLDKTTLACMAEAVDCAAASSCLSGGLPLGRCTRASVPTCDGNALRSCVYRAGGMSMPRAFDCGSVGLECVGSGCLLGTCERDTATSSICNRDRVATCVNGTLMQITDCTIYGGTCSAEGGSPACRGTGAPCVAGSPPTCLGDRAAVCVGGRLEIRDCAAARQRCAAGECQPLVGCAATPSRCDGTVLTVCGPAGSVAIDCAVLGFATCDAADGGRCRR